MKSKKRFLKRMTSFLSKIWASLLLDFFLVVFFLALGLIFNDDKSIREILSDIFTNGVTITVIIVEIIMLMNSNIKKVGAIWLEESKKIFDDYHEIIRKYSDYKTHNPNSNKNYYSSKGELMTLTSFADCSGSEHKLKKQYRAYVANMNSELYKSYKKELGNWERIFIKIPEVIVFANVNGTVLLKFDDTNEEYKIPEFVENNSRAIIKAHNTSSFSNVQTIRLDDLKYNNETNELTMVTRRTCYYDMLLTNRCMDYDLGSGLTVRNKYEYRDYVLPLNESKLSNQIGIEGLILSNDGWMLIEKRLKNKKTTWRDKFGQPISFSMRKNELLDKGEDILCSEAEEHIEKMIEKGMKKFGLYRGNGEAQYTFSVNNNFLGISRDLTEGGKPNMYFFVKVNCDHTKLKEVLEYAALEDKNSSSYKKSDVPEKNIKKSYYLCNLNKIGVNYNYLMKLNNKNAVAVNRVRKYQIVKTLKAINNKRLLKCNIEKECGESLLGCLAFYELCRNRIEGETSNFNGATENER